MRLVSKSRIAPAELSEIELQLVMILKFYNKHIAEPIEIEISAGPLQTGTLKFQSLHPNPKL